VPCEERSLVLTGENLLSTFLAQKETSLVERTGRREESQFPQCGQMRRTRGRLLYTGKDWKPCVFWTPSASRRTVVKHTVRHKLASTVPGRCQSRKIISFLPLGRRTLALVGSHPRQRVGRGGKTEGTRKGRGWVDTSVVSTSSHMVDVEYGSGVCRTNDQGQRG